MPYADPNKRREANNASHRRNRHKHRARDVAYKQAYRKAHPGLANAWARAWLKRNPDKAAAYKAANRRRTKRQTSKPLGEEFETLLACDALYAAAKAAVPTGLPRDVRQDVISTMILAVLEGELDIDDLMNAGKLFVRKHYASRDYHFKSLDALLPGMDNIRLIDTITNDREHL